MSLWGGVNLILAYHTLSKINNKPDKRFMAMFIEFMDGDGYFDIGEQKQYNKKTKSLVKSTIRIRLASNVNIRDLKLLEYFVNTLGVGKISDMSAGTEQVRVIFSKKDLLTVIFPLMKEYNLNFLTFQRIKQFALVSYILENSIIHWDDVNFTNFNFYMAEVENLIKLYSFSDWLVGFTIAEGSFGMKKSGSAFYQLRQSGDNNVNLLKAAGVLITGEKAKDLKPDSANSYQLSLTSKKNIEQVITFFSSSNNHSLYGYKLDQYLLWLTLLKTSKRYSSINISLIKKNDTDDN